MSLNNISRNPNSHRSLIQILDAEMFDVLQQQSDFTHFYFCYRWFLLDFKRELLYDDIFLVWEVIWSARHVSSENFVLFLALALLEHYRDIILQRCMDFSDIVKFFNGMVADGVGCSREVSWHNCVFGYLQIWPNCITFETCWVWLAVWSCSCRLCWRISEANLYLNIYMNIFEYTQIIIHMGCTIVCVCWKHVRTSYIIRYM